MEREKLSPMKAIREKCIECSGGYKREVVLCVVPECALFVFRRGSNPNRAGVGGSPKCKRAS
jgi:hypothetical protein